jgi:MOSC domain-containing protein YiiM
MPPPSWIGEVVSLHLASKKKEPMRSVERIVLVPGKGIEGDRYFEAQGTFSDRVGPSGEVTLIELEAIEALDREAGIALEPGAARRNVVTRGAPLNHLVGREFLVGGARLRGLRLCEPCSHLERLTKPGVLRGLIHRGGLRAQVVLGGKIRVGDRIERLEEAESAGGAAREKAAARRGAESPPSR